jgi:hypothetical protein
MKSMAQVTANSAAFSALTTLATAPAITTDGLTQVEVVFSFFDITKTVAGDAVNVSIYEGASVLMTYRLASVADPGGGSIRVVHTPAAGTRTYSVQASRVTGSGTATLQAAATYPAILTVKPF